MPRLAPLGLLSFFLPKPKPPKPAAHRTCSPLALAWPSHGRPFSPELLLKGRLWLQARLRGVTCGHIVVALCCACGSAER